MTTIPTAFQSFARRAALVGAYIALLIQCASADAVAVKRGRQAPEEIWGKITYLDNERVSLDLECGGRIRNYEWDQLQSINFSTRCRPGNWFGTGGFITDCRRGQTPRYYFIAGDNRDTEITADSVRLEGDRVYLTLPLGGGERSYRRNAVGSIIRLFGCGY
jgi:hypothetical protein